MKLRTILVDSIMKDFAIFVIKQENYVIIVIITMSKQIANMDFALIV